MDEDKAWSLIRILEQYRLRFSKIQLEKVLQVTKHELKARRPKRT